MRERIFVEGAEDDFALLLEQVAVGFLIEQRRAEGVHFPRVVAAPDSEHGSPLRENVGGGEVLREAQGVPHGGYVEAAAYVEALGDVRQMDGFHEDVGQALVALRLEVVLRHPEGVVSEPVHRFGYRLRLVVGGGEMVVAEPPRVHGDAAVADVVHIHMSGVEAVELGYHRVSLLALVV